jgi:hypothetical protein
MSRARAEVCEFGGGLVGHGIYDGTSDILSPLLCDTAEDPWDIYYGRSKRADGRNPWDVRSACTHAHEFGYAWSDYGGGFYWPVGFCRECMVIHGPLDWDGIYDLFGPDWPKDGTPPIEGAAIKEIGPLRLRSPEGAQT